MKNIVPIGLLVLLLYNTFGLSFAILFFERDFQSASVSNGHDNWKQIKMYLPSLPYSGDLEVSQHIKGLVRHDDQFYNPTEVLHQNDTLYVTLKANQPARDHFFELANAMQAVDASQTDLPKSPFGKILKQLSNLATDYVSESISFQLTDSVFIPDPITKTGFPSDVRYLSFKALLGTPPPERA
ncbi:hypothetical protein [Dyadobacter arcticus]|uniref:Uncharacterized protein n=1 Tax=Dyadobacter arcticus TaxID=1078754 RepID=A0ABX0USM8_9BACT|nr:hypothetical protein [Dyadobacter arcticus]NIJ54939.1 hypothetical protein [Dyadobacter arcticus]